MKLERRPIKAEVSTRVTLTWDPDDPDAIVLSCKTGRGAHAPYRDVVLGALYLEYRWVDGAWQGVPIARGWQRLKGRGLAGTTHQVHPPLIEGGDWPASVLELLELHRPAYEMRLGAALPIEIADLAEEWPLEPGLMLALEMPPIIVGTSGPEQ